MNNRFKSYLPHFLERQTPFYFYDLELLEQTAKAASTAANKYGYELHYAFKANTNVPLLKILHQFGFGADCVSGNEIQHAINNNFPGNKIVFAGVGKTDREIDLALRNDIHSFNCESLPELEVINARAQAMSKIARIALRINPNVNANTHHYITTGLEENKFGINPWELDEVMEFIRNASNLELTGLHFHIGSQITDLQSFTNLCSRVNEINAHFLDNGFLIKHLNLGGGLGVDYYEPTANAIADFESFFGLIHQFLEPYPNQKIMFEPGRCITAQCGTLIARVVYVKKGVNSQFLILDAGMTELMRPALYQAYHKVENLTSVDAESEYYDVVGPICESSDCFGKKVELPLSRRGDLIAIRTAGAYGEVMASNYNMRTLPKAVYSNELETVITNN